MPGSSTTLRVRMGQLAEPLADAASICLLRVRSRLRCMAKCIGRQIRCSITPTLRLLVATGAHQQPRRQRVDRFEHEGPT
jgi:hypothetical protein